MALNARHGALARYESKSIDDNAQALGEHSAAHIVSGVIDCLRKPHLWLTGNLAGADDMQSGACLRLRAKFGEDLLTK
jgi:hypothetical protein